MADDLPLNIEIKGQLNATELNERLIKPKFEIPFSSADFQDQMRQYPVDFPFPFVMIYRMEIKLPEDCSVELPENETFSTYGEHAKYQFKSEFKDNVVRLFIKLELSMYKFPAHEYVHLAELFKKAEEIINEGVLVKKM
jgi:hypothetical protein